jgi:hypothetical protein
MRLIVRIRYKPVASVTPSSTAAQRGKLVLVGILGVLAAPVAAVYHPAQQMELRARAVAPAHVSIEWNRRLVSDLRSAVLEIHDGDSNFSLGLNADQLHSGHLTYRRQSGNVSVRLRAGSYEEQIRLAGLGFVAASRKPDPIPSDRALIMGREVGVWSDCLVDETARKP